MVGKKVLIVEDDSLFANALAAMTADPETVLEGTDIFNPNNVDVVEGLDADTTLADTATLPLLLVTAAADVFNPNNGVAVATGTEVFNPNNGVVVEVTCAHVFDDIGLIPNATVALVEEAAEDTGTCGLVASGTVTIFVTSRVGFCAGTKAFDDVALILLLGVDDVNEAKGVAFSKC